MIGDLKNLWKVCFGDTDDFIGHFFEDLYDEKNTLFIKDGGKIVSALYMLPYKMHLGERDIDIYHVAGVATLPEYRNRGLVNSLLKDADSVMAARGASLAILKPFRVSFYEKAGYNVSHYIEEYKLLNESLKCFAGKAFDKIDIDVYNNYCKNFDGFIIRDKSEWARLILDVPYSCGNDEAYLFYEENEDEIIVHEIGYKNESGLSSVLNFIYSKNKPKVKIFHAANGRLKNILKNYNVEVKPLVMTKFYDKSLSYSGVSYINLLSWL